MESPDVSIDRKELLEKNPHVKINANLTSGEKSCMEKSELELDVSFIFHLDILNKNIFSNILTYLML